MTRRQKRMTAVAVLVCGVSAATAFGVTAFRKNMMYFYTPTDVASGHLPQGTSLQLGGLVEAGTLKRGDGLKISFTMADCEHELRVRYDGVLPDLFREGQGAIATGKMEADGPDHEPIFVADRILAKHDENYMPPNVAKTMTTANGKHACAPFKSVTAQS